MTTQEFNKATAYMLQTCLDTLSQKNKEYSGDDEDRLIAFKCAAGLSDTTATDALFGMLSKHLVSISQMCRSGKKYSLGLWEEKIGDAINYLLLLYGLAEEASHEKH